MACAYPPQSIYVGIIQPLHNRPTNGLQTDVPVIRYTLAAFRIGVTMTWPETYGSAIDSPNIVGNLLVEVWCLDEDHALDTHKHLQQSRFSRLPFLLCRSRPGSQKRQTNLSTVVKVWIEPDSPTARSTEVYQRGHIGILHRQEAIEFKEPACVRCILWACDHNLAIYARKLSRHDIRVEAKDSHYVVSNLIDSNPNSGG